jgi:type IV secretory pathway component VirB8
VDDSYQEDLAKKLIKNYVKVYERYNYDTLRDQYIGVYRLSSSDVFSKFTSNMDLNNPDSPLHKYGRGRKNQAIIVSIDFPNQIGAGINTAIVKIKNIGYGSGIDKNIEEYKQAVVKFMVSDIEEFDIKNPSFKFTVVDYNTTILEQK